MLLVALNLIGKLVALRLGSEALAPALACWVLPDCLLAYHVFMPRAQGLLRVHRRFTPVGRQVWLTIDDGPDPEDTPRLLALLAAHRAQATFFVIGAQAAAHPGLIRDMLAAGHEVAHHTHTHPLSSFWIASPARVRRELDDALAVLAAAGATPTRFRAPAGIKNIWLPAALRARRLTCIGWTARGLERRLGNADAVAARVLRALRPGAILLLHEGPRIPAAVRVHAIERVLTHLTAHAYSCVVPTPDQLSG